MGLSLFGCATHPAHSPKSKAPKPKPEPAQIIETTAGSTDYLGAKDEILWKVFWQKAEFAMPKSGEKPGATGSFKGVSGQIYKVSPVCAFSSDSGYADDITKILTLTNNVRIVGLEQKTTLTCDKLIYFGKEKFFKAQGHVRILGTMNMVGTLEEVWATPDLKKIASPDMFNQPMKSALLASGLLASSIAMAQFSDGKGLDATARSYKMTVQSNVQRTFELVGKVSVASVPQGLSMASDRMHFEAVSDPKDPKRYLVKRAVATGSVVLDKVVKGKSGTQTTHITGPNGEYRATAVEGIVNMSGPVKIVSLDEGQHQTMVATGSSCIANLEPLTQSRDGNGLRKATLQGPVKIALTQVDASSKQPTAITATSDHLVLENIGARRTVTLTGHVRIVQDNVGEFKNLLVAVLTLDKKGYWQVDATRDK